MKRKFFMSFETPMADIIHEASDEQTTGAELNELMHALEFAHIWKDQLMESYGGLNAVTHLSNPDDPPDVVFHFERGDLPIEVTSGDPGHLHKARHLHSECGPNRAISVPPLSAKSTNRDDLLNSMFLVSNWESITDRDEARANWLLKSIERKMDKGGIKRHKEGVLLFYSDQADQGYDSRGIKLAFNRASKEIFDLRGWKLAFLFRCCSPLFCLLHNGNTCEENHLDLSDMELRIGRETRG